MFLSQSCSTSLLVWQIQSCLHRMKNWCFVHKTSLFLHLSYSSLLKYHSHQPLRLGQITRFHYSLFWQLQWHVTCCPVLLSVIQAANTLRDISLHQLCDPLLSYLPPEHPSHRTHLYFMVWLGLGLPNPSQVPGGLRLCPSVRPSWRGFLENTSEFALPLSVMCISKCSL